MRTVRILAIVLLLGAAGERVRAGDAPAPEALQAANELFDILSPDILNQLGKHLTDAVWPMLKQMAEADKIDDATLSELRAEYERIQIKNLSDMLKEAPPIYARHFNVGELHDLIAFYRSPTGAKAMRELPQVTAELVVAITPRLQAMQREAADRFADVLRAHGYMK